MSCNNIFMLYYKHGLTNKLIELLDKELAIVKETSNFMETQASLNFVRKEFSQHSEEAFDSESFQSCNFKNV